MRASAASLVMLLAVHGCAGGGAEARGDARSTMRIGGSDRLGQGLRMVVFEGTCDASGAVPIDEKRFAVADDEDNVLRIYDAETGGAPLHAADVSAELQLIAHKGAAPEVDLEAATRLDQAALWLASHARSKKGKQQRARLRYFATRLPRVGEAVQVQNEPYDGLLADLLASPNLAPFGLQAAAEKPPQVEGGLNIEGLTAMPDGRVLIGFRNPVPHGRALLVVIQNPLEPLEGRGQARFDAPVSLDLGGVGVRGLSYWRGTYLIAAGHYGDGGGSRLFAWPGPGARPTELEGVVPPDFNPEAFFTPEERDELMLLSDDGTRMTAGERCKDLDDSAKKRFRGAWFRLARTAG